MPMRSQKIKMRMLFVDSRCKECETMRKCMRVVNKKLPKKLQIQEILLDEDVMDVIGLENNPLKILGLDKGDCTVLYLDGVVYNKEINLDIINSYLNKNLFIELPKKSYFKSIISKVVLFFKKRFGVKD